MAKINMPRQTIFPEPGVVQKAQPTGTAGLVQRIEAQQIAQNISALKQATNFIQNAASFGKDIDNLLNQNAAGEFEVAKATAEARLLAEQQRATEPEPLAERITPVPGGASQELTGAPVRVQDDMELYEERFPELLTDITDIGKELKGRARKAYDMWVQTQAPGWQGAMHGMYAQRIKDNTETNYNIVIGQNINIGNPVEVQRLYTEAIDAGVWSFAEVGEQMQADVSAAALSTIETDAIAIADEFGYDAANEFLDNIRSNKDEKYKAINSLLSNEQLEDVRKTVRLRLSDKFEYDNRMYEKEVLEPTESNINTALASYTFGATGYNEEGGPATAQDVWNLITQSGLRGDDQKRWLGYLDTVIQQKRAIGLESDPDVYKEGVNRSKDPAITLREFNDWIEDAGRRNLLTAEHMQALYDDKIKYTDNVYSQTAAGVTKEATDNDIISVVDGKRALDRAELWATTPEGQKAMAENPESFVERADLEVGLIALDNYVAEASGFVSEIARKDYEEINQLLTSARSSAAVADPTITSSVGPVQITNAPEPIEFAKSSLSPDYDRIPMTKIVQATGLTPTSYAINRAGLKGYLVETDPTTATFDLFDIDNRGKVLFWDADDRKWRVFKPGRFQRQRQ